MIPDDANIFSAVKNYYNRKSCFRASADAKNVSHSAFCAFTHCPTMPVQQELHSCLTRFGWQNNNKRKTVQQELVGNSCCFARRRLWRMVDSDMTNQRKSMIISIIRYNIAKRSKLPKEWACKNTARSLDSFGRLKTQIYYWQLRVSVAKVRLVCRGA